MTTIYFVRHAQPVAYTYDDSALQSIYMRPLTEQGHEDSLAAAEFMRDVHVDKFISSTMTRAIQTIEPMARQRGMEILTDARLRERCGASGGAGTAAHIRRWSDFKWHEENGESILSTQRRNIEALKDILEVFDGQTLVIGTHGTAFSTIVNHYDKSWGYAQFREIVNLLPCIFRVRFEGQCWLGCERIFEIERRYPRTAEGAKNDAAAKQQ